MPAHDVPSWIDVTHGTAPILLLAPHGGRRHDVRIPGKHKVNDLLTAEVTRQLGAACGASTIVNEQVDRNILDLNRLSQVRRDARWLIDLLGEMLGVMVTRFGHATLLVVHGWNVSQSVCDVGVGLDERDEGLVCVRPGSQTVSDVFVAQRLRPLQSAAAEAGITITIGSRYPAAHPNNLLELFRTSINPEDPDAAAIAALRRRGRLEAAQLELAIPLRWPGPRRDRLVALLAETFSRSGSRPTGSNPSATGLRASASRVTRRRGLQFVAGEALVLASIDAAEGGVIAGRLVVSRNADQLVLFTGEIGDPRVPWRIPPLAIEEGPAGGLRVVYDGPLVSFPSHTPFLDLERGLAGGSLIEGRLDVTFRPEAECPVDDSTIFGEIRGELVVDGQRTVVATRGVAMAGLGGGTQRMPSCRLTLAISPWGTIALATEPHASLRPEGLQWIGTLCGARATSAGVTSLRIETQLCFADGVISLSLEPAVAGSQTLHGRLERLMPVRRPGREGTVIETTFALLRIEDRCLGWIEVSMLSAT